MNRRFWLWGLALVAVAAAGGGWLYAAMAANRRAAEQELVETVHAVQELVADHENSVSGPGDTPVKVQGGNLLRTVAEYLRANPAVLQDGEALRGLCNAAGAEELLLADASGRVVAGVPAEYTGRRLDEFEYTRHFAVSAGQGGGADYRAANVSRLGGMFTYTCVPRRDAPGLLVLGHRHSLDCARNQRELLSDICRIMAGRKLTIRLFKDGEVMNRGVSISSCAGLALLPTRVVQEIAYYNTGYLAYMETAGPYAVAALYPLAEVQAPLYARLRALLADVLLVGVALLLAGWWLLRRYYTQDIDSINQALAAIAAGHFSRRVQVGRVGRIRRLSAQINYLCDSLHNRLESESERARKELSVARCIQGNMMPQQFPAFPERPEFDIYARQNHSKLIDGDFYDYLLVDGDHLVFFVGNTTIRGMAAALLLMRAVSLLRRQARSGAGPVETVRAVGGTPGDSGMPDMDIALAYGELELSTGRLTLVNAAQNPPLLCRAGQGVFEPVPVEKGVYLGMQADGYTPCRLELKPGDRLFLTSQGVTTALNAAGQAFGSGTLQSALGQAAVQGSPYEVVRTVNDAFCGYMADTELQAGITLLCLEFRGRGKEGA